MENGGRSGVVELLIAKEKNNQEEHKVERRVQCVCHAGSAPAQFRACPACSIAWLTQHSSKEGTCDNDQWVITEGVKGKALKYDGFPKSLRDLLALIGGGVFSEDGRCRYGTQSLRRGGAQALAAVGWSVPQKQRWGRWQSDGVFTYILRTEFSRSWISVAPAMLDLSPDKLNRETGAAGTISVGYKGRKPLEGTMCPFTARLTAGGSRPTLF